MNWKNKIIAITPFVCAIVFFILWLQFDKAHPGWVVFLLIPLMPFLLGKKKISVSVIIIIIYLIVSLVTKQWRITWIMLLLIPIINILMQPSDYRKKIKAKFDNFDED